MDSGLALRAPRNDDLFSPALINAIKSALVVAASVVGMPCGKPLQVFSVPRSRAQRSVFKSCEIEAIDLLQQFDKGAGAMKERRFALGGGGEGGIAERAARVQILRQ